MNLLFINWKVSFRSYKKYGSVFQIHNIIIISICAKLESFCPVKHYLHITNIHVLHRDRVHSHVSDINIYSDI